MGCVSCLDQPEQAGFVSKSSVSRICRELRDRYAAFCNTSLAVEEITSSPQRGEHQRQARPH